MGGNAEQLVLTATSEHQQRVQVEGAPDPGGVLHPDVGDEPLNYCTKGSGPSSSPASVSSAPQPAWSSTWRAAAIRWPSEP